MNAAHLHITLVHIPIVVVPLGFVLLLLAILRKNGSMSRVALSLLVAATLTAVPAFLLGEGAEEIVEDQPGVSEHVIEEHEEAADIAFWCTVATGVVSLASLVALRLQAPWQPAAEKLSLVLALAASCTLGFAAQQGGKIRHPEAFSSASQAESDDNDETH